jgi:hypothetical protein
MPEARAVDIAELVSEGMSVKGTARKTRTHPSTVRRLVLKSGQYAQRFHDAQAQQYPVRAWRWMNGMATSKPSSNRSGMP